MRSIIHFLCGLVASSLTVGLLFYGIHGIPEITLSTIALSVLLFCISIPVHEMIHGITCTYMSENSYKTISYGISLKGLHAYCRYTLPIEYDKRKYVSIMPCVILAVFPAILGLILGNALLCLFAILNLAGASEDIHKFILLCLSKPAK